MNDGRIVDYTPPACFERRSAANDNAIGVNGIRLIVGVVNNAVLYFNFREYVRRIPEIRRRLQRTLAGLDKTVFPAGIRPYLTDFRRQTFCHINTGRS